MAPSVPSIGSVPYRRAGPVVVGLAVALLTGSITACRTADAGELGSDPPVAELDGRVAGADAEPLDSPEDAGPAVTATTTGSVVASTAAVANRPPVAGPGPAPTTTAPARPAPAWLGRRTLPTTPDGRVVVPQTTPGELLDRRLETIDRLPPPRGDTFEASVGPVAADILARSTWTPDCPVEADDLAYVTVTFWGFDQRPHTGELLVDADAADGLVDVFERLYRARFPIEEMRVVGPDELTAPPTGDGNNTTAFVCRPVTGGTSYSEHAYGLAIDVNPFLNPYQRDDLVLPELAGHYLDRSVDRPGMIEAGDVAVEAFAAMGWSWGGDWRTLKDYQHFSHNGR
jgi:hypothetical protein